MVTLYGTFGSAGTGWIDEQSMRDIYAQANTYFPLAGKYPESDV